MSGYTLELFYKDGKPDGLITAEVFGWTGHLLKFPRTRLRDALTRTEATYTGVYLLLTEEVDRVSVYIGETDSLGWRIQDHELKKDWWTHSVWITSAANKLNKAHVRYLEARLYEEVVKVGQADVRNGHKPGRPSLSEAESSNMEAFLAQVLMALPALRVDVFIESARPALPQARTETPAADTVMTPVGRFKLESSKRGVLAYAFVSDGEFIVEKGSTARPAETNQSAYASLHQNLARARKLISEGEVCRFVENIAFKSPSAAAAIVMGRSANGTMEWRTVDTGMTYKQWEATQIGAAAGDLDG